MFLLECLSVWVWRDRSKKSFRIVNHWKWRSLPVFRRILPFALAIALVPHVLLFFCPLERQTYPTKPQTFPTWQTRQTHGVVPWHTACPYVPGTSSACSWAELGSGIFPTGSPPIIVVIYHPGHPEGGFSTCSMGAQNGPLVASVCQPKPYHSFTTLSWMNIESYKTEYGSADLISVIERSQCFS